MQNFQKTPIAEPEKSLSYTYRQTYELKPLTLILID